MLIQIEEILSRDSISSMEITGVDQAKQVSAFSSWEPFAQNRDISDHFCSFPNDAGKINSQRSKATQANREPRTGSLRRAFPALLPCALLQGSVAPLLRNGLQPLAFSGQEYLIPMEFGTLVMPSPAPFGESMDEKNHIIANFSNFGNDFLGYFGMITLVSRKL